MPNWCENELEITGSRKELERLRKFVMSDFNSTYVLSRDGKTKNDDHNPDDWVFDFNSVIPYPEKYARQDLEAKSNPKKKDGYNNGGYEWCVKNWGTKWDACDAKWERIDDRLFYSFNTAWSPPLPVIRKLIGLFPKLEFELTYYEGGMAFQGKYGGKGGEVITDEQSKYDGDRGG